MHTHGNIHTHTREYHKFTLEVLEALSYVSGVSVPKEKVLLTLCERRHLLTHFVKPVSHLSPNDRPDSTVVHGPETRENNDCVLLTDSCCSRKLITYEHLSTEQKFIYLDSSF